MNKFPLNSCCSGTGGSRIAIALLAVALSGCAAASAAADERLCNVDGVRSEGVPGPEDFAPVQEANGKTWLLVSSARRGFLASGPKDGAIYSLSLSEDGSLQKPQRLDLEPKDEAEEANFHPIGISYLASEGQLYVANDGGDDPPRITVLHLEQDGDQVKLTKVQDIWDENIRNPNDLLILQRDELLVTNPRPFLFTLSLLDPFFKEWPGLAHCRENRKGSMSCKRVPINLVFGNGVAARRDGQRIYVADYATKDLHVLDRRDDEFEPVCRLSLEAHPDNLTIFDEDHPTLYVAAQRSQVRTGLHLVWQGISSPSLVYAFDIEDLDRLVDEADGGLCGNDAWQKERIIWEDGGAYVSAGSTALRVGNTLIVSQIRNPELFAFDCRS